MESLPDTTTSLSTSPLVPHVAATHKTSLRSTKDRPAPVPHPIHRLRSAAACAAALAVLAMVGGCSSSPAAGDPAGTPAAGSSQTPSGVAYAECMRKNGVPSFPDPNQNGGIKINAKKGSGVDPNSPEFKKAAQACQSLRPAGVGSTNGAASEKALKFAECMRSNGVPNFPDPKGGGGIQIGGNGVDPQSPAFKTAMQKCRSLLPNGGQQ